MAYTYTTAQIVTPRSTKKVSPENVQEGLCGRLRGVGPHDGCRKPKGHIGMHSNFHVEWSNPEPAISQIVSVEEQPISDGSIHSWAKRRNATTKATCEHKETYNFPEVGESGYVKSNIRKCAACGEDVNDIARTQPNNPSCHLASILGHDYLTDPFEIEDSQSSQPEASMVKLPELDLREDEIARAYVIQHPNVYRYEDRIAYEPKYPELAQFICRERQLLTALGEIASLRSQLTEAKAGWDSCIADLRKAAEICREAAVDAERKGWNDAIVASAAENDKKAAPQPTSQPECPWCGSNNSVALGGNERCFHCSKCGYVQCVETCSDPSS